MFFDAVCLAIINDKSVMSVPSDEFTLSIKELVSSNHLVISKIKHPGHMATAFNETKITVTATCRS